MTHTKYANAQDEAAISRILRTMKPKLDGTDLWGYAKEAVTYLVVNGNVFTAEALARDFMAGRPAFVDDRIGGTAAQSSWAHRTTKGRMFKAVKALNAGAGRVFRDAPRGPTRGPGPRRGGGLSAAFHGVAAGLGGSGGDARRYAYTGPNYDIHSGARWAVMRGNHVIATFEKREDARRASRRQAGDTRVVDLAQG